MTGPVPATRTPHGARAPGGPPAPPDLYVTAVGGGPTMLVMHGGMGFDHTYLRPWLDPLGAFVRLVYYDHRGNGRSPGPDDWGMTSNASWAADADALRAALGAERVIVFGHSYGGVLAQEYALRYPGRVAGLVLCATHPGFDYAEAAFALVRPRATPGQLAVFEEAAAAPFASDAAFAEATRAVLPLYFHRPTPDRLAAFGGVTFRAAAYAHAAQRCLPTFSSVDRLREIGAPTLVLNGSDDWYTPVEHAGARLVAGIPGAELVVFEDSGHYPFVEEGERFCAVVAGWLRRTGLVAGASDTPPAGARPAGRGSR